LNAVAEDEVTVGLELLAREKDETEE